MKQSSKACPMCGSREVVPIVYGLPTDETMAESEKGKFALGGCVVGERDPRKKCLSCGETFDRPTKRTKKRK